MKILMPNDARRMHAVKVFVPNDARRMHAVETLIPNDARRMHAGCTPWKSLYQTMHAGCTEDARSATTLRQNDAELKLDDLCKDFPSRIQKLIGKEGDRPKE